MAELFEDLGLRQELVAAARDRGYSVPTALQRSAIPVLRRRGNALLHAAPGAGKMAAYGLAIMDHLAEGVEGERGSGVRGLVIVPTDDDAIRTADSLAWFGRAAGVRVSALAAGWGDPAGGVLVGSPAALVGAVQGSRLKLEGLEVLVLDGASAIFALDGAEDLETLASLIPRDAQRVVVSAELGGRVDDFAERHLRRALRIPAVVQDPSEASAEALPARGLDYRVVVEGEKLQVTAELIAARAPGRLPVIYSRTTERGEELASALSLRGFDVVGEPSGSETDVVVSTALVESPADALVISYDLPSDSDLLLSRHEYGGVVLVTPRELSYLRLLATRAGIELRGVSSPPPSSQSLADYRTRLRTALAEEDLSAQLLVLEPLFQEYSAAEVAAAASALLRRRVTPAPAPAAPAARPGAAPAVPQPTPSYLRLFIGVGSRDGIVPSDLVGAITGEAQVRGAQIGRIEIRDTFSIVEVESGIAPRVIQAVNGITLKGRSVRADFDRRGSAGSPRGGDRPRRRIIPRDR